MAASSPSAEQTTDRSRADFRAATSDQWRRSVLTGDVSAVELTQTALTAAATMNSLGAFLHLDADSALARAAHLDATLQVLRGRRTSPDAVSWVSAHAPLLGLPTAFKDLVPVAGMPLTMGSAALEATVPATDHPLAKRVHHSGSVSMGKTQVPEFGLPCYSENQVAEPARNPLAASRTAGGSSGGAAAAVASGILPWAPGNDGGGSVRIPAAACGVVGLKPGRRRLADDPASPSVQNLAVSGPIAATAEDAALGFDVMAGHRFALEADQQVESSRRRTTEPPLAIGPAQQWVRQAKTHGMDPLRIGVTTESPFSPDLEVVLAEEAIIAVESGIARLTELGHNVQGTDHCTGADPFWPQGYHEQFRALWTSKLGQMEFEPQQYEQLEPLTRYFIELARARPAAETEAAIATLQGYADDAEAFFGPWDLLLTPMLASAPPEVGWFAQLDPAENYEAQCRFTPYSSVINVLGLPAINVPMHDDAEGLSWSVQIIGKHNSEEQLLALAALMLGE